MFSFMLCFTNILNIFFSFATCSMHKNPHKNAGNGIKETLFFKIFPGSMPPDPPRGSRVSRANSCPPPKKKISNPVRLWLLCTRQDQVKKETSGKEALGLYYALPALENIILLSVKYCPMVNNNVRYIETYRR